jgi:rhomboid protease GluP
VTPSRFPGLTLAVLLATAAVTAAALYRPEIATALERNGPLIAAGQLWRLVTTWLVETDGWMQIAVNFAGLAVFGVLVERLIGRLWWLVGYVVAGLAGEIAGLWWQPVGGGNSVAVCGLIGVFSVWQARRQREIGPPRFLGLIFWLGLGLFLLARRDIHGAALVAGFTVGAAAFGRPLEARHA